MFLPVRFHLRARAAVRCLLLPVVVFSLTWPRPAPAEPPDAVPAVATICPLGATMAEIKARYGPVLRHNARVRHHQILEGGTVLDGDLHGKNGLVIRVVYHQNHAVLLEFTRAAGVLTPADVNVLLAACAGPSTWEMGKDSTDTAKFYHRADSRAIAHWSTDDDGSLLVASDEDSQSGGNVRNQMLP